MSNLNTRSALHPRWTTAPLATLAAFEACIIRIFDPASATSGDDFNPYAPGGNLTSKPTLLWEGPAQMQVYRQALTVDDVAGSVTQLRSIRFTADLQTLQFPIRKGQIIRVTSAPHDPAAADYEYTVTSGLGSTLGWKRTIECESDMQTYAPPITEYNT